jgi:hypothetical protein
MRMVILVVNLFLMGGLIQKLVFKSGSEGLNKAVTGSFFDFVVKDIYGKEFRFDSLRDRKLIMVVNVACK